MGSYGIALLYVSPWNFTLFPAQQLPFSLLPSQHIYQALFGSKKGAVTSNLIIHGKTTAAFGTLSLPGQSINCNLGSITRNKNSSKNRKILFVDVVGSGAITQ
jgi:hypothetical protein